MQVHCSEGVAIHTGPEPCTAVREDHGEASVGERTGQPLSRESKLFSGADALSLAEGSTSWRDSASIRMTRRGRRTWHVRTLFVWEPGDLWLDPWQRYAWVRIGKARSRSQ